MRRTVARIGIATLVAFAMGTVTIPPPTRADDPPVGIIAPARASAIYMNYAINLSDVGTDAMNRAVARLPYHQAAILAGYPRYGTFFAQSNSPTFAQDLAQDLAREGVGVHSIGPTRTQELPESDRMELPPEGFDPDAEPTPESGSQSGPQSGPQSGDEPGTVAAENMATLDEDIAPTGGAYEQLTNWGSVAMHAAEAAAVAVPHAPVVVGVIDTGVDDRHPDMIGRVDSHHSVSCTWNGMPNQEYGAWKDYDSHGTMVAGIIAANHNGYGIDGIAPDSTIVSIKAADAQRHTYPEALACAFTWAVNHGVDIVNNSYVMGPWRYWDASDPEQAAGLEAATRAITFARSQGVAIFAAAANDDADNDHPAGQDLPHDGADLASTRGKRGVMVPQMIEGVNQVSAVARQGVVSEGMREVYLRADFSNYGKSIDFAAPGDDIESTVPNDVMPAHYANGGGTSFASPHAVGVAALIKSVHPTMTGDQIVDLMRKQAAMNYDRLSAPKDGKEYRGYGFPDALDAVLRDQPRPSIMMVNYRVAGGSWTSVDGAVLPAGPVDIQTVVTSPVTNVHLDVAGLASVDRAGSGQFLDDALTVTLEGVDLSSLIPEGEAWVRARVQVSASGNNADPRADDDEFHEATFTVARDPSAVPTPQEPDPGAELSPGEPVLPGITSPQRTSAQLPANYAVNLAQGTDHATFQRALARASNLKGLALGQYPEFGTFFVQSASPTFAFDLGEALAGEGIRFDSIGPTREVPVGGNEAVVPLDYEARVAANEAVAAAPGSTGALGVTSVEDAAAASSDQADAGWKPDPQTGNGWHLQALGALEAQGVDVMRGDVTVGILDQGVDDTIADLAGQVDPDKSVSCAFNGIASRDPSAWRRTTSTHGTAVAGAIAAKHDGHGTDGVNPTLRIAAINVASANGGYFYPEYVVCGFAWAANHGISVTNSSFRLDPWMYWLPRDGEQAAGLESVRRAINYAASHDVINVVAAGNNGFDLDNPPSLDDQSPNDTWKPQERRVYGGVLAPAMLDNVVPVSALARTQGADGQAGALERASWSNWGARTVAFAAPGQDIYAPMPSWAGDANAMTSGTSMASPLVAGVLATLRQVHPDMNASQILELARKQASDPANWDRLVAPDENHEYRGAGMPSALDAVLKDQPRPTIGQVEYSSDGATWSALAGASVSGRVSVRVRVSGPVTSARLAVDGREVASASGSGAFTGDGLVLRADGVDVSASGDPTPVTGSLVASVEAQGRNSDARADDDVSASVTFTVTADPGGADEAGDGQWMTNPLGRWWRRADGTYPASTSLRINGSVYRFDAHGYVVTGWFAEGGHWYYYTPPTGEQAYGWVRVHGSWYYLDPTSGVASVGWVRVGGTWFYFSSSGAMRTGWLREGPSWYYLDPSSGAMKTGWLREGSSWYYLDPSSGAMRVGWLRDGDSWYYLSSSGVMVTGTRWIDGKRYVFDARGRLRQ